MKKMSLAFLCFLCMYSCSSKKEGNFTVNATIVGLQKGTIYLEKIENNQLIAIDSVYTDTGAETISFHEEIQESEIYVLSLDKSNTQQISFFGEPGVTNITTQLKDFHVKAKISGSEQQIILEKHDAYAKKIKDVNLDLIKELFEAEKENNTKKVAEIKRKKLNNLKRLYLFSTNYAIAHKNKAIAPFIAYTRMENATLALKQKIYDALTSKIKESKYGKLLKATLN